ncbi:MULTISPECIES: ferredoxin [Catenuloplanes]|uniref:Ferredoxin n=1 Tax=Catenuloplanes niger TaxID=587534 RepID=A0AAE3ZV29_9ACTN|nr:ferredoxin [Catenuloplanes niger]MDR7325487.1 ferredoxin [Catenuloplanes niger]
MTKIHADTSRCIGAGQCVLTDPDAFDQDDAAGIVIVLRPEPPDDAAVTRARQAVLICPSQALSLEQ